MTRPPESRRFATIAEATGSRSPAAVLAPLVRACGLNLTTLRGRGGSKRVVRFRQVAVFLIRNELAWSWSEIASYFDGRDHSTMIHSHRTVRVLRTKDPAFARFVDAIEKAAGAVPILRGDDAELRRRAVLAAPARGVMLEVRDLRAEVVGLRDELVRIRETLERGMLHPLRPAGTREQDSIGVRKT